MLLIFIRCFDRLRISPTGIIFRRLFVNHQIEFKECTQSPTIEVQPYSLQKYEWQRKLLRQNPQTFWLDKAVIQFHLVPHNINKKTLTSLRLDLFSKQQRDEIIQILQQHAQLSPTIQLPNNASQS